MGGLVTLAIELYKAGGLFAFAVNIVASAIISKVFAPSPPELGKQVNPGSKQQLPPSGSNKIPVIYGNAWTGGMITDMSISSDNQDIYWVLALSEVTNTESGVSTGNPDDINFGEIYWGGKRCLFQAPPNKSTTNNASSKGGKNPTNTTPTAPQAITPEPYYYTQVIGLEDTSTGEVIDMSDGDGGYYMNVYLYSNGSDKPYNTTLPAYQVLNNATGPNDNLIYEWNATKKMTNCVFAIIHLKYNTDTGMTGLQQTRFQIINSRSSPGDCFMDYLQSSRYGAGIYPYQIDTASFQALNDYSNQIINYTDYNGTIQVQKRYAFNGSLETSQKLMTNIQTMSDCCNTLIRYNEVLSMWGAVLQTPNYEVAMALSDSNIIGSIIITPIDVSNSFNIIEVAFADNTQKDTFTTANFDLAQINPDLLFPNEPVNKQSVQLNLVNNSVQAQYIANQMLEGAREDLQVQCEINFNGLQLQAGDIVTLTNANYGFVNKLFRVIKVTQKFNDKGEITAQLSLTEYNPAVFDNKNVTEFIPSPNTGIGSPRTFGTVPAPIIVATNRSAVIPYITTQITTSSNGITQYAEVWYSAYQYPTPDQYIFANTTEIQPNGNPYTINYVMPDVQLTNIPSGNWYLFSRMVNSLGKSTFSPASDLIHWRPTTLQYSLKYLSVAYADDLSGTGFTFTRTSKTYFGLANSDNITPSTNPANYRWFSVYDTSNGAYTDFGTTGNDAQYVAYINRGSRLFSFNISHGAYNGSFVATDSEYDQKLWSALPDDANPTNIIDLDIATGQLTQVGITTQNSQSGQLTIENTDAGQLKVSLQKIFDFNGGTFTGSASTVTIDETGRVVGFDAPDEFYMTIDNFTATSGQTVFTPTTRASGYFTGQDLIYKNGILLDPTNDYTETSSTFTLNVGATTGDKITCISFRAVSTKKVLANTGLTVSSVSGTNVYWNSGQMPYQLINAGDEFVFDNLSPATVYTVSSVDYSLKKITFTASVTAYAGNVIYNHRDAGDSYRVFSRFSEDLISASTYTPTIYDIDNGFENLFLNGSSFNDQDYDISGSSVINMPATLSGKMTNIQLNFNNFGLPVGSPTNLVTYFITGQDTYSFSSTAGGLNIYGNGVLYVINSDYTASTASYTLTNTPTNSLTIMNQQTFARAGST